MPAAKDASLIYPALDAAAIVHAHAERAAFEHAPRADASTRAAGRRRRRRLGRGHAVRTAAVSRERLVRRAVAGSASATVDALALARAPARELHGLRTARLVVQQLLERPAGDQPTGGGYELVARWSGRDDISWSSRQGEPRHRRLHARSYGTLLLGARCCVRNAALRLQLRAAHRHRGRAEL
jgi:hypothetical protein